MDDMKRFLGLATMAAALSGLTSAPAAAQTVHEIRMIAPKGEDPRFDPASVTARVGDVLLFRAVSGGPHSVVFEGKGSPSASHQALNAAMPRRSGDLSSPLLTDGLEYRMVVPKLPEGTYRFFCLPHRAYDMRGELRVK
jgi:plastocyanin